MFKKEFLIFAIVLLAIGMMFVIGCGKMPMETEKEIVEVPCDTCDCPVDSTVAEYFLTIIANEAGDGPQIDSVRTYLREGDPAQDNPWPNDSSNYTPVNPNRIEPGTYLVVGKKDGYHDASTVVTVPYDSANSVTAYLVMHRVVEDTVATYHLTVNSGYGDGDYAEDELVNIYADAALPGDYFVKWTGDVQYVNDSSNPETSVIMPAQDIVVTATYAEDEQSVYHLTVNSGYGDGDYTEGEEINIYADDPQAGYHFVSWTDSIQYVDDFSNPEAVVTMPDHDIIVTATYVEDETDVISDSLIYIEDGDTASVGDTLIVQGTKTFDHYRVVVLNGSDGPIRHIDMCTGWDYKNNQQFIVIEDCCSDIVKIPLDQFIHMYDHVTLQVDTDPEEVTDWLWFGRFDILIGLRMIIEMTNGQWYDMERILP